MPEELQFDQRSGLWYRPGTYDLGTIRNERVPYSRLGIGALDVVLDIGSHIGSFIDLAIKAGAHAVVGVEPAPDNLRVLSVNYTNQVGEWGKDVRLRPDCQYSKRVTIYNGAAVRSPTANAATLYLNNGINHGMQSIIPRRGRKNQVQVAVIDYDWLLGTVRPTIVKIDVEGSEYNLLWPSPRFNPECRAVAIEVHRTRKDWKELAQLVDPMMQAEGFTASYPLRMVGRASVGVWSR